MTMADKPQTTAEPAPQAPAAPTLDKGTYEIIRLIPDSDDDPQYRVKSAAEPHERVVPESQLELSAKQASLLS